MQKNIKINALFSGEKNKMFTKTRKYFSLED